MIRRKLFSLLLISLLVLSSFPLTNFTINYVDASQTMKIRVLEIVDNGSSQLSNVLDEKLYEVETVRMKHFVALREELDGKYDVIVIGNGNYSTTPAGNYSFADYDTKSKAHNTTNKQNDITNLKANEIVTDFIGKGQLVVIHNDALKQNRGKLYNHFNKYKTANKTNVLVLTSFEDIENKIEQFYAVNNRRPQLTINTAPAANSTNVSYKAGDSINFEFAVVGNSQLIANFYIDANFNHRYESNELFASNPVTGNEGSISYKLPRGYSGLRFWKVEVVDSVTGLKDYETGIFHFNGEKVELSVLQVTRGTNDSSSLLKSNNMNQSFLSSVEKNYDINIDVIDIQSFNDYFHKRINGNYDMVIFGFTDVYNSTVLSQNAAASLKTFIATNQSVMFTHDTIFKANNQSGNIWINNFMDATGQIAPLTDLGYGAPQQSNNTKKVNEGLLTQYPFTLSDNVQVATTHNQYYTVDLEDPSVIMWYNLIGGYRDIEDSWNHYYTYSKGNVTYSGTGHTSNNFPVQEQELFVNTMYRAFLGANTAPYINIFSPSNGQHHLSSQDLELVYEVYDLDLTDRQLKTKVYVNNGAEPIYTNNQLANGGIVRFTIPQENLTSPSTKIRIEVEDASGAIVFEERTINIQDAKLNIHKTLNKTKAVIAEPVDVKYTISIDNFEKWMKSQIFPYAVTETALNNLDVIPVAQSSSTGNYGWLEAVTGSGASKLRSAILEENYLEIGINETVKTEPGQMNNVINTVKNWLDDSEKQVVIPIVAEYPNGRKDVLVKELGIFKMYEQSGSVYLRFAGYLNEDVTLSNLKIAELLPSGIEVNIDEAATNINKETTEKGTELTIELENISLKQLYEQGPLEIEYSIKSNKPGIYVMDQSTLSYQIGNSEEYTIPFNTTTLQVVQPVTGVKIKETSTDVIIGDQSRRLFFEIIPENATNKPEAIHSASWSSSDASVISIDKDGFITAHKKGEATITITVPDVDGVNNGIPFTDSLKFNGKHPLDNITIDGNSELFVNDQETFTINTNPAGVNVENITWTIVSGNDVIELQDNGQVKAIKRGEAVIKAEATFKNKTYTAERVIKVKEFLIVPDQIEVNIGETNNSLEARIYRSANDYDLATDVTWQSSNPSVATIASNGNVTGQNKGKATITATITTGIVERTATALVTVNKVPLNSININGSSELFVNDEETFTVSTEPAGVNLDSVDWTVVSGDNNIDLQDLEENDVLVKAKKAGTATIKVHAYYDNKIFPAERSIQVKEFKIDPKQIAVNVGETNSDLEARIYRSADDFDLATNVIWQSSNSDVATVDSDGKVTGQNEGTATITAKIKTGNVERLATATVNVNTVALEKIIAPEKIYVNKGETKQIPLTFEPANATDQTVTFSINNKIYADVESSAGIVTGKNVNYGYVDGKLQIIQAATVTITSDTNSSVSTKVKVYIVEKVDGRW